MPDGLIDLGSGSRLKAADNGDGSFSLGTRSTSWLSLVDGTVAAAATAAALGGIANPTVAPTLLAQPMIGESALGVPYVGVPAGTYTVGYTWTTNAPGETALSPTAQIQTRGPVSWITVTPPALPAGANGYNVYIAPVNTGPLTKQTQQPQTGANYVQNEPLVENLGIPPPVNSSAPTPSGVLVQNDPGNTAGNDVYVGNATSQSFRLQPGQGELVPIHDLSLIYVKAVAGAPRVNWHAAR